MDLSESFVNIITDNLKKLMKNKECEDQFVCYVRFYKVKFSKKLQILTSRDGKEIDLKNQRIERNKKLETQDCPVITIVLESPHKDEYYLENNKIEPIGPACGKTGKNIKKYLCNVLNKIEDEDKSSLKGKTCLIKLVNAIQYPCSLFAPTEFFRTDNFSSCWKNEFIDDFKERLNKNKNDIIINCCTKGDKGANLKGKVGEVLEKEFKEIPLYECGHPSSWTIPDNRVLKKIKKSAL